MKHTKYFALTALAALVLSGTECTTMKYPNKQIIEYAPVVGWAYSDTIQVLTALDMGDHELILKHHKKNGKLDTSLPEYAIGDTVIFRYYPQYNRDTIYADNVLKNRKMKTR